MRPFFKFKMSAAKRANLSIYDEIGPWGVTAGAFRQGLDSVKDADEIDVEINSYGGDVFTGLSIYNMLKASGKKINVSVMGVAASAASLIAMAGDSRSMPKNSFMMIHNPWGVSVGNADEMRATADLLDKIGGSLHETYAKVTGMEDEPLRAMLAKDTWLTAEESLEHGFATVITDEIEAQASFPMDEAKLPDAVKAIYAMTKPKAKTQEELDAEAEQERLNAQNDLDLGMPVATAVHAAAIKAGLPEHADFLAVASESLEDGQTRVRLAAEVVALAKFAKRPDTEINALVRGGKSVAECRTSIMKAMADEDVHVNATPPVKKTPPAASVKPASDVFAARAAQREARKAKSTR